MLSHRVISSTIIIAVLLAVALWMPGPGLALIVAAISLAGTYEFSALLRGSDVPHCRTVGLVASPILVLATWYALQCGGVAHAAEVEIAFLLGYLIVIYLAVMLRSDLPALTAVPSSLLMLLYVPFLINFITKLLFGWADGVGRGLVLYMILIVKLSDIAAYFVGSAWGRHKAFPRISPAKSWEGCAAAVVAGVGAAVGVVLATGGDLRVVQVSVWHGAVLGLLLSVSGIFGDLVESTLKRAGGVKDSGSVVRGMGGILDVIDSLLLASPVLYVYCRVFLAG